MLTICHVYLTKKLEILNRYWEKKELQNFKKADKVFPVITVTKNRSRFNFYQFMWKNSSKTAHFLTQSRNSSKIVYLNLQKGRIETKVLRDCNWKVIRWKEKKRKSFTRLVRAKNCWHLQPQTRFRFFHRQISQSSIVVEIAI